LCAQAQVWLKLSSPSRISGGKRLKLVPIKGHDPAADILRLCARDVIEANTVLGAYGRRMKARLGAPKAIKSFARKAARLLYRMLKYGADYVETGERYYEAQYQQPILARLCKQTAAFGFALTAVTPASAE
jgi:transposase